MKLQFAIDLEDIDGAKKLIEKTKDHVDVFEYGTPLVINFGLAGLKELRKTFPDITLLADLKIMDVAGYEVDQAFKAGADITTILGTAEDQTIKDGIAAAHKQHKQVLIDMIGVHDLAKRTKEIDAMKPDYIATHTGYDLQALGKDPIDNFKIIKANTKNAKTAVAGGIKEKTAPLIIKENPDLLIVGGGIATTKDPKKAASDIKQMMNNHAKSAQIIKN